METPETPREQAVDEPVDMETTLANLRAFGLNIEQQLKEVYNNINNLGSAGHRKAQVHEHLLAHVRNLEKTLEQVLLESSKGYPEPSDSNDRSEVGQSGTSKHIKAYSKQLKRFGWIKWASLPLILLALLSPVILIGVVGLDASGQTVYIIEAVLVLMMLALTIPLWMMLKCPKCRTFTGRSLGQLSQARDSYHCSYCGVQIRKKPKSPKEQGWDPTDFDHVGFDHDM